MQARQAFEQCVVCLERMKEQITWSALFQTKFSQAKCHRCSQQFTPLQREVDGVYCLYEYNEAMRDYMHRLKFMQDVMLVYAFHEEIHEALHPYIKRPNTWVVPIPLHAKHSKERTFAQVDELLCAAQIPFRHVLEKTTTERQSLKSREERLRVAKLFNVTGEVRLKDLVIFDDIKTTGVTMRLAKEALMQAGASSVTLIALAGGASLR